MFWTTHKDHDLHKCDKLFGFIGGLNFVSIKWKTTDDNKVAELEPEPEPSTSHLGKNPDVPTTSSYNLHPRKDQPACPKTPEPEGYNLHNREKTQLPEPKPKPSKAPKSPKAKPVKFVMLSYGLRRPRPRVQKFYCCSIMLH